MLTRSASPSSVGDIPLYLNQIIAACRAENPDDRAAAWELLERFPPTTESSISEPTTQVAKRYLNRPEECVDRFGSMIVCDVCDEYAGNRSFVCEICALGNFDICQRCFDNGFHCLDQHHQLGEYFCRKMTGKYYTAVRESGRRNLVTI